MNRKSNIEKIDIDGKKYTRYECTQLQRQIETKIRKQKDRKELLKAAGDDVGVRECNRKIRLLKEKYNEITLKAGLDTHYDRMSVVKTSVGIDNSTKNSIIKVGSETVVEFKELGKINTLPLESEFGKLQTDEIIITNERLDHIKTRHPQDFEVFEKYGIDTIHDPDIIIKDSKNSGTVFMIKHLPETNVNVIVRLALETDNKELKNSVMTSYRIRDKNLKKLEEKNKVLYKKE